MDVLGKGMPPGINSCVLHYIDNNKPCKDGDILLMDFGAEYANYCSDLTRTVPVNGRFSKRQKAVYNSVLLVMKEAINMLRPNVILEKYQKEVIKIIKEITSRKPIAKEIAPAFIESSPKSGPTVLSSIIFKGAGKAPDRNSNAKSVADWKLKSPVIIPFPPSIGSLIWGALINLLSNTMASLLPT